MTSYISSKTQHGVEYDDPLNLLQIKKLIMD